MRRRLPLRRSSSRRRTLASSKYHGARQSRRSSHSGVTPEIAASRAGQIQQALIQAGDLHGQPTGRWDAETREAMKLYQKQNGFETTGLPDSKSLMKMGLGPHPLPLQADPLARAVEAQRSQQTQPSHPSQQAQQADAGLGAAAGNPDASAQPFPPQ